MKLNATLTIMIIFLLLLSSAVSAQPEASISAPVAIGSEQYFSLLLQPALNIPFGGSTEFYGPVPSGDQSRWKMDFVVRQKEGSESHQEFLVQRGEYNGRGFGLLAEMGDIRLGESTYPVGKFSRRGGRFMLQTGAPDNALKLESFATSGVSASGTDGLLVGLSGELSILAERASFKTFYLSGRESVNLKSTESGERKGDVLGLLAVLEPFKSKLALEAEVDFTLFDRDTTDESAAVHDRAYRLKLGGAMGGYRYTALYERTGPEYRLLAGNGPRRDSAGIALALETKVDHHFFDFKLSRYNDNTANNELYPRLYRYQGLVDYSFRGIPVLPLGLQYRKTLIDSEKEPLGLAAKELDEDGISARLNYLTGRWDLGLKGSFSQRTDKINDEREAKAATFAFSPRFASGRVAVAPEFSLKLSKDFINRVHTDQYAVNLGINGKALESNLDYEIKGGFKKEWESLSLYGKESLGANLKAAYPLTNLFKGAKKHSIGIIGECNGISSRLYDHRSSTYTLLLSVEGKTL